MIIDRQQISSVTATISLKLEKSDYESKVEDALKEYRRKVEMKGFRPGTVPMGLFKKLYGKAVLFDQVNKIVTHSLIKYIDDEKLDIYGEPLPNEELQQELNFENPGDFEFWFDIGLRPEIRLEFSNEDVLPYYSIVPDNGKIDSITGYILNQYGTFEDVEISEKESRLWGNIAELDINGNVNPEGYNFKYALLFPDEFNNEETINRFIGLKCGDAVQFNFKDLSEEVIAGRFRLAVDEAAKIESVFSFELLKIQNFKKAEMDTKLFDHIFTGVNIKTPEEFRNKITEIVQEEYDNASDLKFYNDLKKYLVQKLITEFPSDFLKRWMAINHSEDKNQDFMKNWKEYDELFKWLLIRDKIIQNNNIAITDKDQQDSARKEALSFYRNNGIINPKEESVAQMSDYFMSDKKASEKYHKAALQSCIIKYLKQTLSIDIKKVSMNEFKELIKGDDIILNDFVPETIETEPDDDHK